MQGPPDALSAVAAVALACACAGAGASAACGYRFTTGDPALPEGVGRVRVEVFENRSPEPEAGAIFARALEEELERAGMVGEGRGAARITGEVEDVTSYPAATGPGGGGVGVYRVTAVVRLRIVRDGRTLCTRELAGGEDFLPARDLLGLEAGRRQAVRRLAASLMREAALRLCPPA